MHASLSFGTAGIPLSTKGSGTLAGLDRVGELGLSHLELEFVHGVKMGETTAREINTKAHNLGISLSVHGPYYINLNAVENEKQKASIERVYQSARVGAMCGADAITFHPAYYLGQQSAVVAKRVDEALDEVLTRMQNDSILSRLKPETTGKPTQWGSLDELLDQHARKPALSPTIDFAHLHARDNGRFKTLEDVRRVFEQIEQTDRSLLADLHCHLSGIEYSAKGEKNHVPLDDPKNKFPWRFVIDCMHEFNARATIVSETPDIEKGALIMKKYFEEKK